MVKLFFNFYANFFYKDFIVNEENLQERREKKKCVGNNLHDYSTSLLRLHEGDIWKPSGVSPLIPLLNLV